MDINKVWVSPNPHHGWRQHPEGGKDDIIKISDREGAIERARAISVNNPIELIKQKIYGFKSERNSYGPDPFPPRF